MLILSYEKWRIETVGLNYAVYRLRKRKTGIIVKKQMAFCVNLEEALKYMFNCMIIRNIEKTPQYTADLASLRAVILSTKKELDQLLVPKPKNVKLSPKHVVKTLAEPVITEPRFALKTASNTPSR
jgi:hypothetical protein